MSLYASKGGVISVALGRSVDYIAYHLQQSFKLGEVGSAIENKIGYDLSISLTKGRHAFIVATHIDKVHIHSHVVHSRKGIV